MRKPLISVLLVAMVVLSGCSAVTDQLSEGTPTGSGTFSETVTLPQGGVAGEQSVVRIQLNNTASSEREYEATLTADGEQVASESATVASGESTTLSLTHTFEETGEHTISVGDRTRTITVYDDPRSFVTAEMDAVETATIEETSRFDGAVNTFGGRVNATASGSATIVKNYTAERLYEEGTLETTADGETSTETTKEWVADGFRYTKTVDGDGETEYERELSDEFDDDTGIEDEDIEPYLRTAHTDEEYVYVVEANTSADATTLWESFDETDESISAESLTYVYFELHYDRQSGRLNTLTASIEGEGGSNFAVLDMTITQEYVAYGNEVPADVPPTVRDRAES